MQKGDRSLALVLPVYNEETAIGGVLEEWADALEKEAVNYVVFAVNDGSKDRSLEILRSSRTRLGDRLEIIDQSNSGHGRSCRAGYEAALANGASWVFQIDSDGQCDPAYFEEFWRARQEADCIFGQRIVRDDGAMRQMISTVCRAAVAMFTGTDVKDANVPYRLMRRSALEGALTRIPQDFDLQNIALTLALKRDPRLRWRHIPIRFRIRRGGAGSLNFPKIVKAGLAMLRDLPRVRS